LGELFGPLRGGTTLGNAGVFCHELRHQPGYGWVIKQRRLSLDENDIVALVGRFQGEGDRWVDGDIAQLSRVRQN
jgi:hypothetical protein